MRVLVCGGRDFKDWRLVYGTLDILQKSRGIDCVIHGAARGADRLGKDWARSRMVMDHPYPAEWDKYGKAAGPIRNQRMLDEGAPDLVIAFPGGKGTADMVRRAKVAGIEVIEK